MVEPGRSGAPTPGVPAGCAETVVAGRLGGDLFAAAQTPHGLRLLIADVRGKGHAAAGGANALLGAFHTVAHAAPSLTVLAEVLERTMLRYSARRALPAPGDGGQRTAIPRPRAHDRAPGHDRSTGRDRRHEPVQHREFGPGPGQRSGPGPFAEPGQSPESGVFRESGEHGEYGEHFATALLAGFSPDGARLRLLNRGHPAPLLLRPDARVRRTHVHSLELSEPGPPLGLRALALPGPGSAHATGEGSLPFPPDGTLLLVTDGTTEARNRAGVFYDPAARLSHAPDTTPDELLRLLRRDVTAHAGGQIRDDMALLAVRPVPDATGQLRWLTGIPRPAH
ncbi:PP2C family protein-serine/threonine phosphatase [Streptomyces sp. AJS327]|uniref:PP2C family protein-serine/threonine phosphatase n=1 Tax=Streptomyces sp. AJS327 TaxID=2545265 RepID=UPI001C60D02B|nr:PP2C family protein-serine/threonine phosphatase [Streptomyces sp. AJS327]